MFWYLWLIAAIVFLGIEIVTTGVFFFICFSVGALFAMAATLLNFGTITAVIIFCIISLLSVFFVRPLVKKYTDKKTTESNVDSLIGQTAVVTTEIKVDNAGQVKTSDGDIWLAVSHEEISAKQTVKILSVDGTKLVVEKI